MHFVSFFFHYLIPPPLLFPPVRGYLPFYPSPISNTHLNLSPTHLLDVGLRSLEGDSVLDYACANVSIEIVKLLVNSGANVNDCDTRGWGCLHNACELGPKGAELVEFLVVDCLANPMLTTSDGKLPVDITREPAIKLTLMRAMKQSNLDHEFLDGGIEF